MQLYSQDACVLVETHLSYQSFVCARQCFPTSWGFHAIMSQGPTKGIIIVWKSGVADIDAFERNDTP